MKQAGGRLTFIKNKELQKGFKLTGQYLKSRVNEKFGNMEYLIKTEAGTFVVNGSGQLDGLFEEVSVGSTVDLTYEGMDKIKKGKWAGTEAHQWKLLYEDAATPAATSATPEIAGEEETPETAETDEIFRFHRSPLDGRGAGNVDLLS